MKVLLKFLPVLLPFVGLSQPAISNFSNVDYHVKSVSVAEPDSLARSLTKHYTTEIEKVRAIFSWITQNISYQVGAYKPGRNAPVKILQVDAKDTATLKTLDVRVAEIVLERKLAVCDGYARLFHTLCNFAGIRSEIIQGYANDQVGNAPKFRSNHKWNAVMIDSSWYLLDATWGSGYITFYGNHFIQHLNESYFLTDPAIFIKDHYPEDTRWTLLNDPPIHKEYNKAPYRHMAFFKHKITSFAPAAGVIEAALGDSITIELETDDEVKKLVVTDVPVADSLTIASLNSITIKPAILNRKIKYTYNVTAANAQWLQVIYDQEVIMKYKLNIKKSHIATIKQ
ncbi:MAG: hypothetical protein JWQ96_47 [Segetibacter sp.]|nr:hypothetical protein [Segetibacter sp.]